MRKHIVTLSVAKPKYSARTILKAYELFIDGDIHYITKSFFKKCAKLAIY
jgi:hypothetical protein